MTRPWTSFGFPVICIGVMFLAGGCWVVHRVGVVDLADQRDSVAVTSPVKAHLLSGHTVVFTSGATIARDTIRGAGVRYDLRLTHPTPVEAVPLDSIVGMENYRTEVDAGATFVYSALTTVAVPAAAVAITCALDPKCFGSCPTFYSDSAGTAVLEAEGFSYSIAPLFEARDVDRLRAQTDPDGALRLETRNEAFETHYLNHLELLEVHHVAGETVIPDTRGDPLAIRRISPPGTARDLANRDVRITLSTDDGDAYHSDQGVFARARLGDLVDAIELTFAAPSGQDSAALVFRMRNSLLNTVLLYDMMLGDAGARSLDWVSQDLNRIGPAVALGQWYVEHLGMRVAVWKDGAWQEVGRVKDTGPVAWKDVALLVPAPPGDSLRIRLSFLVDNWRIDRVGVGQGWRRPTAARQQLQRVEGAGGVPDASALASLAAPDGRYLETQPGQYFTAIWTPASPPPDSLRTFLLASQGYYTEWVRRIWIATARRQKPFTPSDTSLAEAVARYRSVRDSLEARFAATRVPVR